MSKCEDKPKPKEAPAAEMMEEMYRMEGYEMMEGGEMRDEMREEAKDDEIAPMMMEEADMEMGRRSTQSAMMAEPEMMMEEARPKSEAAKMEWLYTIKKDVKTDKMLGEDDPEVNDVRVSWV